MQPHAGLGFRKEALGEGRKGEGGHLHKDHSLPPGALFLRHSVEFHHIWSYRFG